MDHTVHTPSMMELYTSNGMECRQLKKYDTVIHDFHWKFGMQNGKIFPDICHPNFHQLEADELRDAPVLVFANKQDLPYSMPTAEVAKALRLDGLRSRKVRACAIKRKN